MTPIQISLLCTLAFSLAACANDGVNYGYSGERDKATTYQADQVNKPQAAQVVNILAVLPATIQTRHKHGGKHGLAKLLDTDEFVPGVSLTYEIDGETLNSAQVGTSCEFAPGKALMIKPSENETRIQPNQACAKTN